MNGNYYVTKLMIKLKQKKVFIWITAIILFLINYDISSGFFRLRENENLVLNLSNLEAVRMFFGNNVSPLNLYSKENMFLLKVFYYFVALVACKGYGNYIYEFFARSKEFKPRELTKDNVVIPNFPYDQDKLQLIIGLKHKETKTDLVETPKWIIVPEKGLYQDFLISGGKGTGKTQSCMYPFTKQMIYYKAYDPNEKAGMLILDVKGNYTKEVLKCAEEVNRLKDVIVINLSGQYRYNPLHKPSLRPQVIANRLRTVLELFSTQHADSYWLDKAEVLLTQAIKLVRLYNKGYVTFVEVHKLVNVDDYLNEKIEYLQELEDRNKLSREQKEYFKTVKDYFLNEYRTLDTKISSVIKSEVTRMTQTFIDDPDILKVFCAPKDKLNFFGFDDLVDTGKIVVLDMNIAEFRNLSKIIAAYLKLDFQSSAMMRLTRKGANRIRPLIFISDEYQEYVTANDADFYAVSREARCINIVSTQSYSSLLRTLKSEEVLQTILTNLTNKIWLRTDDKKTAEIAESQCGTIKKKDIGYSLGKGGSKKYSYLMGREFGAGGSSVNESYNISVRSAKKFDIETFTTQLPTFTGVCYLSDGDRIMPPTIVHLEPYFREIYTNLHKRVRPAPNDPEELLPSKVPNNNEELDLEIEDNFDFESNSVISKTRDTDFDKEYIEDVKDKDTEEDFELDFDNFDIEEAGTPEEEAGSKYDKKEIEEDLKKIEGIFDDD